jgi:serine/threonine protein kinase
MENYVILNELGRGGMAKVYLAEHRLLRNKVALKVLNDNLVRDLHIRKRFLAEARSMAAMSHPNIIKVIDLYDSGDHVAFVMEYIEGETLKEYLERKGRLSDTEIKALFPQMLDAVGYVHEQNLVHRDIKPSNFMLDRKGKVKLMDFGIAKTMDATSAEYTQTGTGLQMGTPMYMSPEQISETKSVTAQSDIYSLGVVLWQMVTGEKPYDTKTISNFQLQMKIIQERLPSTGSYWDDTIQIATNKEAPNRYTSCQNFIAFLQGTSKLSFHKDATVLLARTQNHSSSLILPRVKSAADNDILEWLESFIKVEGGSFQMGSLNSEHERSEDELLHAVTLSDFYIQAITVSQGFYERVIGENPSEDKTWNDFPVTNVSWYYANAFIEKLNILTDGGFRLPTEAEWEYAARGGRLSKGYIYSGSNNLEDVGWHSGNSGKRLHVSREKCPNELGLYDMSGNVAEWCIDLYSPYRLDSEGSQNPKGPDNGRHRVLRGGSFGYSPHNCRSAFRHSRIPGLGDQYGGIRLVFSPNWL